MKSRWLLLFCLVVLVTLWPSAASATPDPTKITAECSVSNSPNGPFSATNPVTMYVGSNLTVRLFYHNRDVQNDSIYTAHFTTTLMGSTAFGPTRVIDTKGVSGGAGLSTGSDSAISLPASTSAGQESIVIQVTDDVTGGLALPVVAATCSFPLNLILIDDDIDKDGIPNDVEIHGLLDSSGALARDANGKPIADFPSLGANPCRKDLAVQVDFQQAADHTHKPDQAAIDLIKKAFADAPVSGSPGCPFPGFDSQPGINLIIDFGNTVPETTTTPQTWDCNTTIPFEPRRNGLFRHSLWVHQLPNFISGLTPCSGAAVVALGVASHNDYSIHLQAGTFMHELGHSLGLPHGGRDGVNLKPNYLSVMNYSFQLGIPTTSGGLVLNYSDRELPELDEGALNPNSGVSGPSNLKTIWWGPHPDLYYPNASKSGPAAGPLDWPVTADINSDGVCVGPGPNGILETDPEGDDIVVQLPTGKTIFNGPNLRCDTRPNNRHVDGADDTLTQVPCVGAGPQNLPLGTVPALDDVLDPSRNLILPGPNGVCDTAATGGEFQITKPGRSEPRLLGHDDWSTVLQNMAVAGAGVSLPPQPNWTLDEAAAVAAAISGPAAPRDISAPSTSVTVTPSPNSEGWNRNGVNVSLSATDPDGVGDVAQVGYRASGAQPIAVTWVPGALAVVPISAEGLTPLTFFSADRSGNTETATTLNVKIDKTAPTITTSQSPPANSAGWNNSDVIVNFNCSDALSQIAACSSPVLISLEGANQSISGNAVDRAGNTASANTTVSLDKTAPALTMPALAADYRYNSSLTFTFGASDSLSGLQSQQATFDGSPISSGAALTLSHPGTNTFTLTATDRAGNIASQNVTFSVVYTFGGFLPPVPNDASGIFKLGSTIPIKFQLTDANGAPITTATAKLSMQMFSSGVPVGNPIDATPSGNADTGDQFRSDGTGYIFNLSTKGLSTGTWQVQASLDDGTIHAVLISLK